MRIRFRALDLVRLQKQKSFVQIERDFSCGDSSARFRAIQQLGFWNSENSSQRRLLCLAPRRVHFARPWTQPSEPALTDSRALASASSVEDTTTSKGSCGGAVTTILLFVNLIGSISKWRYRVFSVCSSISLQVPTWCHLFNFSSLNLGLVCHLLLYFSA